MAKKILAIALSLAFVFAFGFVVMAEEACECPPCTCNPNMVPNCVYECDGEDDCDENCVYDCDGEGDCAPMQDGYLPCDDCCECDETPGNGNGNGNGEEEDGRSPFWAAWGWSTLGAWVAMVVAILIAFWVS